MPHSTESLADRYPLLFAINNPAQLRERTRAELPEIVRQLREFLIESVAGSGGHFAAGLGVVELTVALHYVFDTPRDKLVWDVGHLCYPHKILTGRRDSINTIRKTGGLASFPDRAESEYDCFGVGHAGTAISAALGMGLGFAAQGMDNRAVAIVGDGGMTAGLSYEALNHAGGSNANVLVVLNDNEMSISPNVGALRQHLEMLASTPLYQDIFQSGKRVLGLSRNIGRLAKVVQHTARGVVHHDNIFSALGFQYFGPIDGHDISAVVNILRNLSNLTGPRLLHLVTTKGKGYRLAEENPVGYHGVSTFDPSTGIQPSASTTPSYSKLFSHWVCNKAEVDSRLCAITPAMREGSGLVEFEQRFADRYFDVGIAEQHALTLASGLACAGLKPVVAIYSTFLQRAYDQLIHDVWLQNLDVTFAVDRAGVVGGDGATHNGAYDLSFVRCLSGMVVATPSSGEQAIELFNAVYKHPGPALIRYPRDVCASTLPAYHNNCAEIGKACVVRKGKNVAILVFGVLLDAAREAAQTLNATLVDMRFAAPLDTECLDECFAQCTHIVTIEEGVCAGGIGEAVGAYAHKCKNTVAMLHLGLPPEPVPHGVREQLLQQFCGLDAQSILDRIQKWLAE